MRGESLTSRRALFRASSGTFARLQSAAGREYLVCMKNIAKRDNYNAILVNRSDTFTKWLEPDFTRLTSIAATSYRLEPARSRRVGVGISDNFVKIGMDRFSAILKRFLRCKGIAVRRFNEFETA